jgi:hypothetical protein
MRKKVGIIVNHNSHGKTYHRLVVPFHNNPDVVFFDGIVKQNPPQDYDVIIFNSVFPQPIEVLRWCKKEGVKIVMDIDDFHIIPHNHPSYRQFSTQVYQQHILECVKLADVIWCATEELVKLYRGHYVPNAIDYNEPQWNEKKDIKYDICYTGGIQHLEYLSSQIKQFPNQSMSMVVNGYDSNNDHWKQIKEYYGVKFKGHPVQDIFDYGKIYSTASIAVAPAKDITLNYYKSPLKLLEAAAYSLPVVCSNIQPYKRFPVLYDNWRTNLLKLKRSKEMRIHYGCRLREYVDKRFNLQKINEKRWQTLA